MPIVNSTSKIPLQVKYFIDKVPHIIFPCEAERPSLFNYKLPNNPKQPILPLFDINIKPTSTTCSLAGGIGSGKSTLTSKILSDIKSTNIFSHHYLKYSWDSGNLTFDETIFNFREHYLLDPNSENEQNIADNVLLDRRESCQWDSPCRLLRGANPPTFNTYFFSDSTPLEYVDAILKSIYTETTCDLNNDNYFIELIFAMYHMFSMWYKELIIKKNGISCFRSGFTHSVDAQLRSPGCRNYYCDSEYVHYWHRRHLTALYCHAEFSRRLSGILPILARNTEEENRLYPIIDQMFWRMTSEVMNNFLMTPTEVRATSLKRISIFGNAILSQNHHIFICDRSVLDVVIFSVSSGLTGEALAFTKIPSVSEVGVAQDYALGKQVTAATAWIKLCKLILWASNVFNSDTDTLENHPNFLCYLATPQIQCTANILKRKRELETKVKITPSGTINTVNSGVLNRNSQYISLAVEILQCAHTFKSTNFDEYLGKLVNLNEGYSLPTVKLYHVTPHIFHYLDNTILNQSSAWLSTILEEHHQLLDFAREEDIDPLLFGTKMPSTSRLGAFIELPTIAESIGANTISFMDFVDKLCVQI